MMFNIWKDYPQVKLTELLDFIVDNRGKSVPTVSIEEACNHVLIATNCIRNERLYPSYDKIRYISQETYESWFRSHPIAGDIIFVNKGTPGRVCLCPENVDFCIAQDMMAFRTNSEKLYNKYLLAVLRSREIQEQIRTTSVGDTIPHFKKEFLKELYIPTPPLDIQRLIGNFYFAFSNKIELNNKINENLEQQAQAVYAMFFSPKSEITGEINTLDMYCSIFTGKKNANAAVNDGKFKFFTCSPEALSIDSYIYDGSAIIISGNGAYTGRTRFYSGKFDLYQRTYACTILDNVNPDYIFPLYWFVKLELSKRIMGGTRGSAIPYIVMDDLAKFEFTYNETLFNQHISLFKNITLTIQQNEFENEVLAELRDTLLPKLMNGEIDVSEVKI